MVFLNKYLLSSPDLKVNDFGVSLFHSLSLTNFWNALSVHMQILFQKVCRLLYLISPNNKRPILQIP